MPDSPTLFLCQARRGQTTLPFSAPGSELGGKGLGKGPKPASLLGDSGGLKDQSSLGRGEEGGGSEQVVSRPGYSGRRLEEMPAQLPAWAAHGAWAAGTGRGQATSLTKQGVRVSFLLPGANPQSPSPTSGAEGGTHTCLSYAWNVAPQAEDWGGGASWGLEAGEGAQSQEDPAGPKGETEESDPSGAGDQVCRPAAGAPAGSRVQVGMRWGHPGVWAW